MQTVKIPEDTKPWFECSINGKDYKYPAGATVSVPDEVAALIANINASKPKHVTPVPVQQLPIPTAADKVLKSVGVGPMMAGGLGVERYDHYVWAEGDSPAGSLIVTLTHDSDTWTSDVEPADIVAAVDEDKPVYISTTAGEMIGVISADSGIITAATTIVVVDAVVCKLVTYSGGAWQVSTSTLIVPTVYETAATFGTNAGNKKTFTLTNVNAKALYAVATSGKMIRVTCPYGSGVDLVIQTHVTAQAVVASGDVQSYQFAMLAPDGTAYVADNLLENDTVVFTEI